MSKLTIAFIGSKGGVGKSTLAANIASMLAHQSSSVLGIDADPQASFARFHHLRARVDHAPQFTVIKLSAEDVGDPSLGTAAKSQAFISNIQRLQESHDYLVIDAPGAHRVEQGASMLLSQVCVLPIEPSNFSLWGASADMDVIRRIQVSRPDLRIIVLPNKINTLPAVGAGELDALRDAVGETCRREGWVFADSAVCARSQFNGSISEGVSAVELADAAIKPSAINAANEMRALFETITGLSWQHRAAA